MDLITINFVVWSLVGLACMWATHSKHICDGILIKTGLASLALGAWANAAHSNYHAQLWIGISLAAIVIFFVARIIAARLTHQKPVFLVF